MADSVPHAVIPLLHDEHEAQATPPPQTGRGPPGPAGSMSTRRDSGSVANQSTKSDWETPHDQGGCLWRWNNAIRTGARREFSGYTSGVWAIMLLELVAEASRGLVIPSLATYLVALRRPSTEIGYLVAAFSAGRMVAGLGLGWLSTRVPFRHIMIAALAVAAGGNLLYATASPGTPSFVWMGRTMVGFSSGTLSASRAALAAVSTPDSRLRIMAHLGAARFVGYALTPGLAVVFQAAGDTPGKLFNLYRLPGWVLVVADVLVIIILLRALPLDFGKTQPKPPSSQRMPTTAAKAVVAPPVSRAEQLKQASVLVLFLFINTLSRGVLSLMEAVGAVLYDSSIGDTDNDLQADIGEYFLALGAVGFVVFLGLPSVRRRKWLSEEALLALGLCCTVVGSILFLPASPGAVQFVVGSVLIWSFGSAITSTVAVAVFSKILGGRPQGLALGIYGAAGSVGRILFPVLGDLDKTVTLLLSALLEVACAMTIFMWAHRDRYPRLLESVTTCCAGPLAGLTRMAGLVTPRRAASADPSGFAALPSEAPDTPHSLGCPPSPGSEGHGGVELASLGRSDG